MYMCSDNTNDRNSSQDINQCYFFKLLLQSTVLSRLSLTYVCTLIQFFLTYEVSLLTAFWRQYLSTVHTYVCTYNVCTVGMESYAVVLIVYMYAILLF